MSAVNRDDVVGLAEELAARAEVDEGFADELADIDLGELAPLLTEHARYERYVRSGVWALT